jgi:hypothetical protein
MPSITFPNRSTAISLLPFLAVRHPAWPPSDLGVSPFGAGLKPVGRNKTALIVKYCLVHSDKAEFRAFVLKRLQFISWFLGLVRTNEIDIA